VRASQRLWIALGLSLLAHLSLLAIVPPEPAEPPSMAAAAPPLTVRITPPEAPAAPAEPPAAPAEPQPAAPPPPAPPAAAPRRPQPVRPRAPPAEPPAEPLPAPPPATVEAPAAPPPLDMLAMIEARREQRRAAEEAQRKPPAVARPPEDVASRNLRFLTGREGVGGVFQVLRKGTRTGEFAFNGWRPEARTQWREVYEVDAGLNGNIELAMVRRMIELIRTHYPGDFHWESHRLGRVVVLSARLEDSEALEDFLMREFFGPPVLNPRR
jgi:outer membrane biosynthesis protein TonB